MLTCRIAEISIVIPTLDRKLFLTATLNSIANQDVHPFEIIIIDGSTNFNLLNPKDFNGLRSKIIHKKAIEKGAAKQRNQGVSIATTKVIGFFDDDILLEADCIKYLWEGLQSHANCGGINAVITNQTYHPLGKISKMFYKLMGADTTKSLAGKCIGPAINFLPALNSDTDFVKVDWLNTTCTLYRKEALPIPVFDQHFTGYSLMEDLALSLRVGQKWKLLNSSRSRIFHDSQPSEGKNNLFINSEMELVNRYYIMKYILHQSSFKDYYKLTLQQLFGAIASKKIFSLTYLKGKYAALKKIKSI